MRADRRGWLMQWQPSMSNNLISTSHSCVLGHQLRGTLQSSMHTCVVPFQRLHPSLFMLNSPLKHGCSCVHLCPGIEGQQSLLWFTSGDRESSLVRLIGLNTYTNWCTPAVIALGRSATRVLAGSTGPGVMRSRCEAPCEGICSASPVTGSVTDTAMSYTPAFVNTALRYCCLPELLTCTCTKEAAGQRTCIIYTQ